MNRRSVMLGSLASAFSFRIPTMAQTGFAWPNGKRAAVSLTYDDAGPTLPEVAIPQLDKNHLRGSFYVTETESEQRFTRQLAEWQNAATNGHEIGNHSKNHPSERLSGVDPATNKTVTYWPEDEYAWYKTEIDDMEYRLTSSIRGPLSNKPRTYSYPYGVMNLQSPDAEGRGRYRKVIGCNFRAARGSEDDPADPGPQNPLTARARRYEIAAAVPTWGNNSADFALDYMQQALRRGRWAVLVFHDIVDRPVTSDRETNKLVHQVIIDWINANKDIWCAPFGEVFDYIVKPESIEKSSADCKGLGGG